MGYNSVDSSPESFSLARSSPKEGRVFSFRSAHFAFPIDL